MIDKRYVMTIATGKKVYVDMAANLALSFLHWHADSDIVFRMVTDQPQLLPDGLSDKIQVVQVEAGELGEGFSSKLYLDRLAVEGKTLFIDSDCLIFDKLDSVFAQFDGHAVSVVGNYISDGEWFGDIAKICRQFNVPHLPKFNGGIYYLESGVKVNEVYATARELESKYDEIGFVRLRNRPNDEVIMALAMQLHGQTPVIDDGTILSDPQACPGPYQVNVFSGKRTLVNPPAPHPSHQIWYPFEKVSPLVVHFLGTFTQHYPYRREAYRLQKAFAKNADNFTAIKSLLLIEYPERIKIILKNISRPLFRLLFGARKVKDSPRV